MADLFRIKDGDASEVGLNPSFTYTEAGVYLLPRFTKDEENIFSTNTSSVRKLLADGGLRVEEAQLPGKSVYRDERGFTWLGPVIFVTASYLADNPHALSIALGVISNFLTDFFKGKSDAESLAKLDIVVEKTPQKSYRRVSYHGPPSQLPAVADVVQAAVKEE